MQPYPRSPDLVWPGHLHGTGCLSARAMDTGFPTVVWRLCLGPGCAWVWVSVTPPALAGVLGECVLVRFVVSPSFPRSGLRCLRLGLGFGRHPTCLGQGFGTCVAVCALRLHPAVPGSGVRCGRACWGPGSGCAPPPLGELLVCVCPFVPVPCGLLHLLVGGTVQGCLVGPGLLPRPANPGWGVGACVCLCARPACTPPLLAGVCCVGVCWARVSAAARPPLLGCWGVCAVVHVLRLPPPFPRGLLWCGGLRVLPLVGFAPPPLPFGFVFWGALWCRSLVVPVLGPVVSVPPPLLFRAALFFFNFLFPSQRGVCPRVLGVPSPRGPLRPASCCLFWLGGPQVPLWGVLSSVPCGWGVWPPVVVLVGCLVAVGRCAPPPPVFSSSGGVCLFLPLPSLGWRTHWSAFSVVFRVAVGGCLLPGRAPAPWVGWVMYTLGSAPLPAGLGSGSASWAVAPGGFMLPLISRVLSPLRCRF